MRVSRLVGFLGVPSVANAGTLGDLQRSTLTLGSATWKAVYNGMIEVKQVATVYCPTVANQTIKLSGNTAKLAWQNKALSVCVVGGVITAAPGLVSGPLLSGSGFTLAGVKAGSLATVIQGLIGNVAAGSPFAVAQSAGAGGAGLVSVNAAIQSFGTAIMGSSGVAYLKSKI